MTDDDKTETELKSFEQMTSEEYDQLELPDMVKVLVPEIVPHLDLCAHMITTLTSLIESGNDFLIAEDDKVSILDSMQNLADTINVFGRTLHAANAIADFIDTMKNSANQNRQN